MRVKWKKKMKLGVSYSLFDGQELLEASIKSVRNQVDYVNVVYQEISYTGNKADYDIKAFLEGLMEKGLVDEIYLYKPVFGKKDIRYNEKRKRDIGLRLVKKHGCTHYMDMDTDEFYDEEELCRAKDYILRKGIASSAVSIVEYLKKPEWQILKGCAFPPVGGENYTFYVPFIMKLYKFRPQKHSGRKFPCLVDHSRGLNEKERFYLFSSQDVVMHHMSTVRKDLGKKYKNSNLMKSDEKTIKEIKSMQKDILAFDFDKHQLNKEYALFRERVIKKVGNKFKIDIED